MTQPTVRQTLPTAGFPDSGGSLHAAAAQVLGKPADRLWTKPKA